MPKADAWREKNRLAQKAFRQRQKVCTAALAHNRDTHASILYSASGYMAIVCLWSTSRHIALSFANFNHLCAAPAHTNDCGGKVSGAMCTALVPCKQASLIAAVSALMQGHPCTILDKW